VRDGKKAKREEKRTVFLLECGGKYALTRRPESGLLAGLWQLPDATGHLDTPAALEYLTGLGLSPRQPLGQLERPHIFTHIKWDMRCIGVRCGAMPDRFTWLTPEEVAAKAALPTAYRQFWDLRGTFGME
jgi:A/G-specific adenine glycosylase